MALIISIVPIDITIYSPVVLEIDFIAYSAWLGGPKPGHHDEPNFLSDTTQDNTRAKQIPLFFVIARYQNRCQRAW